MIFKGTIKQVLNGTKTQTRQPVRVNHGHVSFPNNTEIEKVVKSRWTHSITHRKIWKVGQTYAVQPGRGKSSIARIMIKKIKREYLQDINDADLLDEGIEFNYVGSDQREVRRRSFINLWNSLYGKSEFRWDNNPSVWVLEFELIKV